MKKLLLVVVLVVAGSVSGGNYIVYRVTSKINRFVQDPATKEWLFDKKIDQLRFNGYFIFKSDYTTDDNNYPARIIAFRPKKVKYTPAAYNPVTGTWDAISGAKQTNKLLVYPYSVTWPNGKVTSMKENYMDTAANDYYLFGGIWDTVDIKRSTFRNHILALFDFFSNDAAALAVKHPELFADEDRDKEIVFDKVIGYSEAYSGWVRNNGLAPTLGGTLNIDMTTVAYKSKQVTFRYNSAITRNALAGDEKTMQEAVDNVVSYLVQKGNASTWAE
jgi:hypothetical protein